VVLLVEDEAVVREITGQVLQSAGYRVLASSTPTHALELAREHAWNVDLLLTDVVMPEMNGIDLAEKLRQLQPKLVTVFMSGYAEGDLLRNIRAQSAMHIQKPFTVNFLLSRLAEALAANASNGRLQ
jgi:CheY-like chemotaxis protein